MKKVSFCAIVLLCLNFLSCSPEKLTGDQNTYQTQGEEEEEKTDPFG